MVDKKDLTIQIYGYFNIPYGSIPYICSQWIRVLAKAGFDIRVKDYSREQDCRFPEVKEFLGEHEPDATVGIYFGYPAYQKTTGCLVAKNKYKVGVFTTETGLDEMNVEFVRVVNWHKVCVPSLYCKQIFNRCQNRNVCVVNHGIHKDIIDLPVGSINKAHDFTFLYAFNNSPSGGSLERKNLHALLEGFRFCKQRCKNVRLIVKTTSNIEADLNKLTNAYPDVTFDIKLMDPFELAHLYASCHAYVNASRAEGFGLTVLEAMASGTVVVSPIHSGLTEFLTPTNCVVIESVEDRGTKFRYATNDGPLWRVTATDIGRSMVEAYNNYDGLSEKAIAQSKYVRDRFSWKSVLGDFIKWLDTLS